MVSASGAEMKTCGVESLMRRARDIGFLTVVSYITRDFEFMFKTREYQCLVTKVVAPAFRVRPSIIELSHMFFPSRVKTAPLLSKRWARLLLQSK